mgnify:FL=1
MKSNPNWAVQALLWHLESIYLEKSTLLRDGLVSSDSGSVDSGEHGRKWVLQLIGGVGEASAKNLAVLDGHV